MQENVAMWKSKPLHGQFLRDTSDTVDYKFQWSWLSISNFKKEIEGFLIAFQDQATRTNAIKFRISINLVLLIVNCVGHMMRLLIINFID